MSKGFVTGHDESIGKGSHANMPQEVMMKEYPKSKSYSGPEYDDTMSDIDEICGRSESKRSKYISNQK